MAKKVKPAALDEEYQRVALVVDEWHSWTNEAALADLKTRLVKFVRKVEKEAESAAAGATRRKGAGGRAI